MWFADFAEESFIQLHLHCLVGASVAERADAVSVDGITSPSLGSLGFSLRSNFMHLELFLSSFETCLV